MKLACGPVLQSPLFSIDPNIVTLLATVKLIPLHDVVTTSDLTEIASAATTFVVVYCY